MPASTPSSSPPAAIKVSLLDYGAGNVRSVRNAILANGYEVDDITDPSQLETASVVVFPGVGSFGSAMKFLHDKGFVEPLKRYIRADRPFLGICLGMQTLFESSDEHNEDKNAPAIPGLGVIPGAVVKFDETKMAVPHIGWNGRIAHQQSPVFDGVDPESKVYFVHSYYAPIVPENRDWVLTSTSYSGQRYVSAVQKGRVVATQFHPEKSGTTGLRILKGFLQSVAADTLSSNTKTAPSLDWDNLPSTQLVKRIVVALDVRTNDHGDLVVTKGDQYDVRENDRREGVQEQDANGGDGADPNKKRKVRNLGKPVALAMRYYQEGGDEIAFLNITSFRQGVIEDMPMLAVLEESSKNIFVPLTVGGGIRGYTDPQSGQVWSALEVASRYFRAGADKVRPCTIRN